MPVRATRLRIVMHHSLKLHPDSRCAAVAHIDVAVARDRNVDVRDGGAARIRVKLQGMVHDDSQSSRSHRHSEALGERAPALPGYSAAMAGGGGALATAALRAIAATLPSNGVSSLSSSALPSSASQSKSINWSLYSVSNAVAI